MRQRLLFLLAALWFGPAVCLGDKLSNVVNSVGRRDEQLQAAFLEFPLLAPATNAPAKLDFHTLALDKPVVIDGINFYGFRFKVPKRTAHQDLVWAFVEPGPRHFWYIMPQTGGMTGFEDFFREPRAAYEGLERLFPTAARQVVLQRLAGDSLADDHSYLIWFAFGPQRPGRISLAFTFADLPATKPKRGALEKALGLHRKQRPAPSALRLDSCYAELPLSRLRADLA